MSSGFYLCDVYDNGYVPLTWIIPTSMRYCQEQDFIA